MTAVMRRADAVLQALIMMRSSITPSLISPGAVDWRMKTVSHTSQTLELGRLRRRILGSRRSLLEIQAVVELGYHTIFISHALANRHRSLIVRVLQAHHSSELRAKSCHSVSMAAIRRELWSCRSATSFASSGWLLPVRSLIEFEVDIVGMVESWIRRTRAG